MVRFMATSSYHKSPEKFVRIGPRAYFSSVKWVESLGLWAIRVTEGIGAMTLMSLQSLLWLFRPPFRWRNFLQSLEYVGVGGQASDQQLRRKSARTTLPHLTPNGGKMGKAHSPSRASIALRPDRAPPGVRCGWGN